MAKFGWLKQFFVRFYGDEPPALMPAVKDEQGHDDFHEQERKLLLKQPPTAGDKTTGDQAAGDDGAGDDGVGDDIFVPPHG